MVMILIGRMNLCYFVTFRKVVTFNSTQTFIFVSLIIFMLFFYFTVICHTTKMLRKLTNVTK